MLECVLYVSALSISGFSNESESLVHKLRMHLAVLNLISLFGFSSQNEQLEWCLMK